ncbi:MAG: outer membrane beta-barrel protein, partial [Flavobacteriaceae bacterium]
EEKIIAAEKPIFVKQPNNQVIVTDNEIATIYSTIEDKYIVDKEDFLEELNNAESITARMESIPEKSQIAKIDKKWSVGPTVAPVFYNSIQDGSPLNEALSNNSRTSDNALSFGVRINYQLTNKFFIQSGVNKVELAYNTKGVNALISSSKNAVNNINTDKYGVILTPSSNGKVQNSGNELYKSSLSGDLNQSIEYYELPIEMKYNLYDKRLGLNLVGGFSTLILSNNSVSLVNQNNVVDLGSANNLNDFNFSGNVGVDMDYKLSKSWYLNVAPMFKYQFNTYSGNSGNFRPYYFGLYSGLNYKF